jgi:hypothetical protein
MTVDDLKTQIRSADLEEFVDSVVLTTESPHFSSDQIRHVSTSLAAKFSIEIDSVQIRVVGSAKLGYGLFKKRTKTGEVLPAFRPFRPESDIDLAIISPHLYEIIWDELSTHANNFPWMPWDSGKLGDYMVYGWLRPDHFPKNIRLRRCDDWWDVFRALSSDSRLGRRSIRGALYHSLDHLRRYQLRGLNQCRAELETQS